MQEERYNKRAVECQFVVSALSMKAGLSKDFNSCPYKTLDELQLAKQLDFEQMLDLIKDTFKRNHEYTVEDLKADFADGKDPFEFVGHVPGCKAVQEKVKSFGLYRRGLHLLNESKKLSRFTALLKDSEIKEEEKLRELGNLMNDSHLNNAGQQDISNPYLDELTEMAREKGALGSKLMTGSYCLSMVKKEEVGEFLVAMGEYYTKKR